jgi:hypothetical protein
MKVLTYTEQLFLRFPTQYTGKEVILLTLLELAIRELIHLKPVRFFDASDPRSFIQHHWVKKGPKYANQAAHAHLDIFLKALAQHDCLHLWTLINTVYMQVASPADFKNRLVYKPLVHQGYFVNLPFLWNVNFYFRTPFGTRSAQQVSYSQRTGQYQDKLLQMLFNLGVDPERLNLFDMAELRAEVESAYIERVKYRTKHGIEVDETGFPVAQRTWPR